MEEDDELIPLGLALSRIRLSGSREEAPTLAEQARQRDAVDALPCRAKVRQLVSLLCRVGEHLTDAINRSHGREQLMRELSAAEYEIDDERSLRRTLEADREENTAALERAANEIESEFS